MYLMELMSRYVWCESKELGLLQTMWREVQNVENRSKSIQIKNLKTLKH